jgi:hypothetical protein
MEGAFQIRVDNQVPVFFGHPHAQAVTRNPGVIDQNGD